MPVIAQSSVNAYSAGAHDEVWRVEPHVSIARFGNIGFDRVELKNRGAIVSHDGLGAVAMLGDDNTVHNHASALMIATLGAAVQMRRGSSDGKNPSVFNDGHIISTDDGVEFKDITVGGRLVNTGTITSDTDAAITSVNATLSSISNSGDLFGYETIVLMGKATKTVITNTGRMEADVYAIRTQDGNTFSLNNSGVVDGIISPRTANGADSVTNSGRMLKNVNFGPGNDTYTGTGSGYAFRVYGDDGTDRLTGSAAADTFYGGSGNDVLDGRGGNDRLMGESGIDRLTGGAGNDVFIFAYMPSATNKGIISDFNVGNDSIELYRSAFTKIGAAGALKPAVFKLSTVAKDADDRIIYNKTSGALFYDSDGSGAAAPILFASLQNKPVVTAADFHVI